MDNLLPLKELRENITKYEKRIAKGDSFIVMRRSTPIFRISPVDEDGWETVIDFTQFKKDGLPAKEILARLKGM